MHCKDWLYLKLHRACARPTPPRRASPLAISAIAAMTTPSSRLWALRTGATLLPEIVDGTDDDASADRRRGGGHRPAGGNTRQPRLCRHGYDGARRRRLRRRSGRQPVPLSAPPACTCAPCLRRTMCISTPRAPATSSPCQSPGLVVQMQTNMAASLNIDWVLSLAADLLRKPERRHQPSRSGEAHRRMAGRQPPRPIVYHPYISEAGERGPFANANARASFIGLSVNHRYPDLVRAVVGGPGPRRARLLRCDGRLALGASPFRRRGEVEGLRGISRPPSARLCASRRGKRRAPRARR